ncbi:MAG: tetratricopeptide repeat protein [Saprospiraceae bacterium]|nr:tetratricopeptide repeat protein [Saprospiraceae bacterium]
MIIVEKIFLIATLLFLSFFPRMNLHAQKSDKSIELESALIDAVREEQTGFPEKAIEILKKIQMEPEVKGVVHYQLAKLYHASGRLDEALICAEESVKADPGNKWFLVFKANLLEKTGRNQQVAQTYLDLVKLEPDNYTFYENAALYWMKSNQPDKALVILQQAQQKFGPLPSLVLRKVDLLLIQEKSKQAIESLNQSIKDYPKHAELYLALADIYARQNNVKEFEKTLDRLKMQDPDHPVLQKMKNENADENPSKDFDRKVQSGEWNLDQAIQFLIPDVEKLNLLSTDEEVKELVRKTELLVQKYGSNPKPHVLLGDIFFNTDQLFAAKSHYLKAESLGSLPYPVWDHLLYSLSHLNHYRSLEIYARKVLDLFPNQSYPYFVLADALYHSGQSEEALSNLRQYLLMQKKSETARAASFILQAKIYHDAKNRELEKEAWENAQNIQTKANPVQIEQLLMLAKSGVKSTDAEIEKAFSSDQIPAYYKHARLAEIKYHENNPEEAKKYIMRALEARLAQTPNHYLLAAQIFIKLKDQQKAKEMIQNGLPLAEDKSPFEKIWKEING